MSTNTDLQPNAQQLILACGALAHEIVELKRLNGWSHINIQCLPPELHNRPDKIPAAVKAKLEQLCHQYSAIFVAYADCGTGGKLDQVLAEYGIERIPGVHCYEFFAGARAFAQLAEAEPGTFYLTDFLVRHFDRIVWKGLGLDRLPDLRDMYFGHYRKLLYLAQTHNEDLITQAKAAAERLNLNYEYQFTGFGELTTSLESFATANAIANVTAEPTITPIKFMPKQAVAGRSVFSNQSSSNITKHKSGARWQN